MKNEPKMEVEQMVKSERKKSRDRNCCGFWQPSELINHIRLSGLANLHSHKHAGKRKKEYPIIWAQAML